MIILPMAPVRAAEASDCAAIADIYNEAIAEGRSTFETEPRSAADAEGWLDSGGPRLLTATSGGAVAETYSWWDANGRLVDADIVLYEGAYRFYTGSGCDGGIYIEDVALAAALIDEATSAGLHKIVGRLFADNEASRRLVARHGFREVGVHLRHGQIDGDWRDVVLVELLLDAG